MGSASSRFRPERPRPRERQLSTATITTDVTNAFDANGLIVPGSRHSASPPPSWPSHRSGSPSSPPSTPPSPKPQLICPRRNNRRLSWRPSEAPKAQKAPRLTDRGLEQQRRRDVKAAKQEVEYARRAVKDRRTELSRMEKEGSSQGAITQQEQKVWEAELTLRDVNIAMKKIRAGGPRRHGETGVAGALHAAGIEGL